MERGERGFEGKGLAEEEMRRHELGARVGQDRLEKIVFRGLKDERGDGGVGCSEVGGEGRANADSVEDDLLGGEVTGGGEVLQGSVCVGGHAGLARVDGGALSVATVVEGKEIDAEVVERGEGGGGVGESAIAGGEIEEGGGAVAAGGSGGNPPSGELRGGGVVWREVDEFREGSGDGRLGSGGAFGMEDELPLPLEEEKAEREISADDGGKDSADEAFDDPNGVNDLGWSGCCGWGRSASFCLLGRGRHEFSF